MSKSVMVHNSGGGVMGGGAPGQPRTTNGPAPSGLPLPSMDDLTLNVEPSPCTCATSRGLPLPTLTHVYNSRGGSPDACPWCGGLDSKQVANGAQQSVLLPKVEGLPLPKMKF